MEYKINKNEIINELELIRLAIQADRKNPKKHVTTIYIFSPPGLGKTVMCGYLAKCYQCPYQIINCVNSMIDLDLLGSQVLIGQETIWQDGPLPSIIRAANDHKIGILMINELNALSVNAQMALNPLLDRQEGIILTQNNNEFIGLEEDSHLLIIATMNPDVLGINEIQDSVRDRASAIILLDYPPLEKEATLISKITKIPFDWAIKFCEVIQECRKAKTVDNSVTNAPSTRSLMDWIFYSGVWDPMLAFEMTIANRYAEGMKTLEGEVFLRIAHGKGVEKWKIPQDIYSYSNGESLDDFHFPSLDPIKKKPKPVNPQKIKDKKERKKAREKQKAEKLGLKPLEIFMGKENES